MIKNKWLRLLVPIVLITVWLGISSVGGPIFGKISDVVSNDQASFLPSSADSTQVQQLQRKYESKQTVPAIIIFEFENKLAPQDVSKLQPLQRTLSSVEGVEGPVIGPIPSKDLRALQYVVPVSTSVEIKDVVAELRTDASKDAPGGSVVYVAGPAGLSADIGEAFSGIDGLLLAVALSAVFIILLVVYRSALLPFLVLLNAIFALSAAILVVYALAQKDIIELNGQSQGILFILVIGAATDYSLLLVARYREALGTMTSKWEAIWQGIKRSFEPIVASAATVILALLCLLFSDLNSNKGLGPIAAIGITFSLLATLTFLPSLLALFGRAAFWPSKVPMSKTSKPMVIKTGQEELIGVWKKVGSLLAAAPRKVWVLTVIGLLIGSLGLTQLKASGVPQTDLLLVESNAVDGQKAIARHFDAGSGAPVLVAVPESQVGAATRVLRDNSGVVEVVVYTERGRSPNINNAKVVDGKVLVSATLTIDPYSEQAEQAIKTLRQQLSTKASGAQVGGTTAIAVDTQDTAARDFRVIVPLVLLMIFIVLAMLLRALIAPLVLIATVVLSFAATLGISALVFNHVFDFPGADPAVPLFGFVFLVALGVDYNIFLITRTREEAFKHGTRAAILHSLGKTGGVITSAGIVLAATFAALGVIPILFLAQLAFIVAFGVLLDTIIVRSLLVPALFDDIGSKVWWPSRKLTK